VLASVLSGQGGRLFYELRDKRSLAYSVTAMSVDGLDPGYFAVYIGTSPEKAATALEGMRAELARVREERIPEVEIERAKRYLIGSHAIGLQRRASVAATLALDELYGLGAEAYREYDAKLRAVTAETLLDAAQKFLNPCGEVTAEVGPGNVGKEG
jgi:zinc protease